MELDKSKLPAALMQQRIGRDESALRRSFHALYA